MVTSNELEWLVLSVCHQVNFDETVVAYERNQFGKDATSDPGIAWYETYILAKKAHGILGFVCNGWSGKHYSEAFVTGLKSKSILQAWKDTYFSAKGFIKAEKWPGAITRTDYSTESVGNMSDANPSDASVVAWATYEEYDGKAIERNMTYTSTPSLFTPYNIEVDAVIDQDTIWEKGTWSGYTWKLNANDGQTLRWKREAQGETRQNVQTERRNDDTALFTSFSIEIYGLHNAGTDDKPVWTPNMVAPEWSGTKTVTGAGIPLNTFTTFALPPNSLTNKGTNKFIWRVMGFDATGMSSWWSPMYELEVE